jgi:hypothetical protein
VSSITNQSRYIVRIRRCPEHTREFPHIKAAEAKAYRDQLLRDHNLVAEIVRGPLRLLLRIRERGVNVSEVVDSYAAADELEINTLADQIRGVGADTAVREPTMAALIERYIKDECPGQAARYFSHVDPRMLSFNDACTHSLRRILFPPT